MKRSCKNIDITDTETVYPWVLDCVLRHKKRHDFRDMLIHIGKMPRREYCDALHTHNNNAFVQPAHNIAREAVRRIAARQLNLRPVRIRQRVDKSSGKLRDIGDEEAMQQVLDHIAVGAAEPIWRRRIVYHQVSSIPGKGQVHGTQIIRKWIQQDNRAARWAHVHKVKYSRKCKYFAKLDIQKCYPSMRLEIFMQYFQRDCGNDDLLWLWETLLQSHCVNGYQGFMIGALPSQWACQYLLSFVYRYAMDLHKTRRGQAQQLVTHMLLYMDDILLFGTSRRDLKSAVRKTIAYTKDKFGLIIKPNWHIQSIDDAPVDMMGYVNHSTGKTTIRARIFLRARRIALRFLRRRRLDIQQARRIASYKGYFIHSDSRKIVKKLRLMDLFAAAAQTVSRHDKDKGDLVYAKNTIWLPA